MKKITSLLLISALSISFAWAQGPAGRTVATIVADVLAQMPADNQNDFEGQIGDLAKAGPEAIVSLVKMYKAPGQGDNSKVDYALSGLTNYVSQKGREALKATAEQGFIQALNQTSERETKAMVIRQLQTIGSDASVDAMKSLLGSTDYAGPASRVLRNIGTKKAQSALLSELTKASSTKKDIVRALADIDLEGSEAALTQCLGESASMDKEVLYALSKVGSAASLPILEKKAAAAGYTMEPTGANEAYINLLKNLAAKGQTALVEKAAKKLESNAKKSSSEQTRIAARLMQIDLSSDPVKMVTTAMKDPSEALRDAVLRAYSSKADGNLYSELLKSAVKAKAPVQKDILDFISREAADNAKRALIQKGELKFDMSNIQAIKNLLQSKDAGVVLSAAEALRSLQEPSAVSLLSNMLASGDNDKIQAAKQALMSFSGKVNNDVAKVIPSASKEGQIAGIEILANRKASEKLGTVLELLKSSDKDVQSAAYASLKDIASAQDRIKMCGLLEEAPKDMVGDLQQAVIATLKNESAQSKVQAIQQRMLQSGGKGYLYYPVLASTGDKKALETIVSGLSTGSEESRAAALDALLSWNGMESADYVLDLMKKSSGETFTKAIKRYITLASNESLTGENSLIMLRKAMDLAKTNDEKNAILEKVGATGTFQGMMYAAQFMETPALQQNAADAVMNIGTAHPEYNGQNTRALLKRVVEVLNHQDSDYLKQSVVKFLGETPDDETGFVSLFNGKDLTGWKGLVEDPIKRAKMKPAELQKKQVEADKKMRENWTVRDGLLAYVGTGFDNLCTVKQYQDFEMYVDWMLDPSGKEPDAGIYLRGAPQVQIWDTARVDVGAQVGSGGLYNNKINQDKPLKVADNKVGDWNSFYIKMVGDRVTVKLNGELVVDDVILENYWDRSQPIFPIEQLELQAHGSLVYFRDIYVKELPAKEPFTLSKEEQKEGYKILFDGTNMYQWTGNTVDYTIEDGCISLDPTKGSGGNLYTKDEFANFIYRFDFQLTPGANNGVGIRTPMEGDAAYVGMEIQILDCEHEIYKDITPLQHHGSVYGIIPAKADHHSAFKPAGEWNTEEIYANGNHIKVTVNGQVILDSDIKEATKNGTADGKEHPGLFNKAGHIGFLGHGSPVKFRNIRIKTLK